MDSKDAPRGYGVQFAWLSIVATLVVVAAVGYPLYRLAFASETFRYRITLEADVDGRPVTGSGVIQETVRRRGQPVVTGEAVKLDLGQNRELFLLFPGYRETPHPLINLPFEAFPDGTAEPLERVKKLLRDHPRAEIPLTSLPILVHFADRTDRMSIHTVNPANMVGAFGPGVRLRKATIEITDDPVTNGLDAELPWLPDLKTSGRAIDGSRFNSGDTQYSWLGYLAFKR